MADNRLSTRCWAGSHVASSAPSSGPAKSPPPPPPSAEEGRPVTSSSQKTPRSMSSSWAMKRRSRRAPSAVPHVMKHGTPEDSSVCVASRSAVRNLRSFSVSGRMSAAAAGSPAEPTARPPLERLCPSAAPRSADARVMIWSRVPATSSRAASTAASPPSTSSKPTSPPPRNRDSAARRASDGAGGSGGSSLVAGAETTGGREERLPNASWKRRSVSARSADWGAAARASVVGGAGPRPMEARSSAVDTPAVPAATVCSSCAAEAAASASL
mmetsp:Transcript_14/g.45  ORF Transcript_14/g.45 Transcript_14/m.45 type:complete len:271 (+) Transcript_14:302-1114(+)